MTNPTEQKRQAAKAALDLLPPSGVIGLGSGSTAELFIQELGQLVQRGRQYRGVATSDQSRRLAQSYGIPLLDDDGPWSIDVTVDGADEVSHDLDLIKGGGACHLREKIVNGATRMNIIVVDETKLSAQLGTRFYVPVEVVRFGHATTVEQLRRFGKIASRRTAAGEPLLTDSGHFIYDITTGPIADPAALDSELHRIPGVVETGLFIGRASLVVVGGVAGTRLLHPKTPGGVTAPSIASSGNTGH